MIEIAPIITTHPIPKIKKVIREGRKPAGQKQSQQENKSKDDGSDDQEQQHIDEIV
ncbi:MAG: hypothetical protein QM500_07790 [Methylococcales bacterium]